jgi:hypothetical protein
MRQVEVLGTRLRIVCILQSFSCLLSLHKSLKVTCWAPLLRYQYVYINLRFWSHFACIKAPPWRWITRVSTYYRQSSRFSYQWHLPTCFYETYHTSALFVQYLLEKVLSEVTFFEVPAQKRIELFSKECRFIMEVSGARRGDTLTGVWYRDKLNFPSTCKCYVC